MKKLIIIVIILSLVVVGGIVMFNIFGAKQNQQSSNQADSKIKLSGSGDESDVSFEQITKEVNAGQAILLDVRTAEEFNSGHAEHSLNLSLQDIEVGKTPEVGKDAKIYVYCRSGNRSASAINILKKAGFTNLMNLGGLADVQKIGATIVQ